jgi:hypothetical protein
MALRTVLFFSFVIIILCFVAIWVFTQPAFLAAFNLSMDTKANIGTAIGGITAPIIGLFSTVLLILTLNKQMESIRDQKLRNDSDLIFSLVAQMERELENVYYKFNEEVALDGKRIKTEYKFHGIEAVDEFTRKFRYEFTRNNWNFTFRQFFQAHQILLIVHSFQLVRLKVERSALSEESKSLFLQKIYSFYYCRLRFPLKKIHEGLEISPRYKDELAIELQNFYLLMESKLPTPVYDNNESVV